MKTLIITLEYPPTVGGIATYVFNVAAHLPANETIVLAPKVTGDLSFDQKNSWKVLRQNPYWSFVWPHWLRLLWQTWNIVKKEKIEQIHVHHALPVGYVAWIIKKFWKIPYAVFLHGSDLQLAEQRVQKFKKFKKVCLAADKVVVNSEFFRQHLLEKIPTIKKVDVVYPCPTDSFFNQEVSSEKIATLKAQLGLGGKKVLLSVSRMVDRKGFLILAKLLPKIVAQVPNLVWVAIGDGPEKNEVIKVVESENLQSVVRILPGLAQEELVNFYHLADLFVLLTHKDKDGVEEAWGTVFIEAAAAGLPIVAGRSGGVEEAVEHLVNGLVVDTSNEEAVVKSIVEILHNPEYARAMVEKGRGRAVKEFQWSKQIVKLS